MDEITLSTETVVSELKDGQVHTFELSPEQFGMKRVPLSDLQGGSAVENAEITKAILSGATGPKRDIVLLNAGASLYIGGVASTMEEGIELAKTAIDSGKAMEVLQNLVEYTNR
jgi:anthranilate phosphoribosyltransferase